MESWLEDQDVEFPQSAISRWNMCVELEGEYVEENMAVKSRYLARSV